MADTGKVFAITEESMRRWKRWLRVIYRDQWAIWFVGCVLGVAIPALISMQYLRPEFLAGKRFQGDEIAAKTAEALRSYTGHPAFWFMTLLCGFLVMAPNQITAADGLVRRWTELLWTGNRKLHRLEGSKVRFVYFCLLAGYLVWGMLILSLRYIPYFGVWVSATMPILLSLAVFDDWWHPVLVFGLYLGLEVLIANLVEPLLYKFLHIG